MTSEITVRDKRWAERVTERLRLQSTIFTDSRNKIIDLLHEAQDGDAAGLLGYKSWTAYISDVFGEQPLRLEKDLRREFVKELSSEGMSTRAIAPIVGASQKTISRDISADSGESYDSPEQRAIAPIVGAGIGTVHRDIESSAVPNGTPEHDSSVAVPDFEDDTKLSPIVSVEHHGIVESVDARTGEILDSAEPKTVTGLDGKRYRVPELQSAKPRRTPITERFTSRTVELIRLVDSFTRLVDDDRFDTNRQNIADTNASDIKRAIEALSEVFDALNNQ